MVITAHEGILPRFPWGRYFHQGIQGPCRLQQQLHANEEILGTRGGMESGMSFSNLKKMCFFLFLKGQTSQNIFASW